MHVGGECGWRGAPRQPPLLLADLGQGQAQPAELLRHRRKQKFGFPQLFKIFEKEPVLPVISSSALSAPLQELIGQHRAAWLGHYDPLPYQSRRWPTPMSCCG